MTEREIFLAVLDLPDPADRSQYLDKVCGDDSAKRARVESLLSSHDSAGSFLGSPAVKPPAPNGDTKELGVDRGASQDDGEKGADHQSAGRLEADRLIQMT